MLQARKYRLTGTTGLIQHNVQLANPLNKWSRAIKKISSKRKKTEADHMEMGRLEFMGGLYMSADGPVVPERCLRAMILASARKERMGKTADEGIFINEHARVEYEGPRDAEALWNEGLLVEDGGFVLQVMVQVQRARLLRTRPMFPEWSLEFTVYYNDGLIDAEALDRWMDRAGAEMGLLERRPQYGRFLVEVVEEVEGKEEEEVVLSKNGREREAVSA